MADIVLGIWRRYTLREQRFESLEEAVESALGQMTEGLGWPEFIKVDGEMVWKQGKVTKAREELGNLKEAKSETEAKVDSHFSGAVDFGSSDAR
ncbi:MAG TPA: hypothetical protein VIH69_06200 [Dehalococcoidia bacterium]